MLRVIFTAFSFLFTVFLLSPPEEDKEVVLGLLGCDCFLFLFVLFLLRFAGRALLAFPPSRRSERTDMASTVGGGVMIPIYGGKKKKDQS